MRTVNSALHWRHHHHPIQLPPIGTDREAGRQAKDKQIKAKLDDTLPEAE